MTFTIEEKSLIQSLDHKSRSSALMDIRDVMPYVQDAELKSLCFRTAQKLDRMTDEEFTAIDFIVEEDTDND